MAIERTITADEHFFLGEDKILTFTIFQADGVTRQNITGWELWFMLKERLSDADTAALVTKKTTDVSNGITITSGAQGEGEIAFADTDTDQAVTALKAKTVYPYSLKRLNAGVETILTFSTLTFAGTTQR